jgi:large subunit ribosomal protein L25
MSLVGRTLWKLLKKHELTIKEAIVSVSIKLNFEPRKVGSKFAKSARLQGLIPVVLYGLDQENEYYSLKKSDFIKQVLGHESELFNVNIGSKHKLNTVIKDQVFDTLKNEYMHLDFMRVDAKVLLKVQVPIKFIGEPVGVKTGGGILTKTIDEVEVECLPENIPADIVVDVSKLKLDEKIMVSDLKIPSDVTLLSDLDLTVAVVHMKQEDAVVIQKVVTPEKVPAPIKNKPKQN